MMVVLVRSRGATWCHLADLVPYAAQISRRLGLGLRSFPLETIDNKTKFWSEAAAGKLVVQFRPRSCRRVCEN